VRPGHNPCVAEETTSTSEAAARLKFFSDAVVAIATAWLQHRRLFDAIDDTEAVVVRLNFVWLLTIVVTPFATRLLTESGPLTNTAHAYLYGFYSLVETISSLAMLGIVEYVVRHSPHLVGRSRAMFTAARWDNVRVIVGFGLSIPLFFVIRWAWVLWFCGPIATRLAQGALRRVRHR
jgi:uncharacterized membrane protein